MCPRTNKCTVHWEINSHYHRSYWNPAFLLVKSLEIIPQIIVGILSHWGIMALSPILNNQVKKNSSHILPCGQSAQGWCLGQSSPPPLNSGSGLTGCKLIDNALVATCASSYVRRRRRRTLVICRRSAIWGVIILCVHAISCIS